jgi:hypothetical protein
MFKRLTVKRPNGDRAIMGQMSCWRGHAVQGNVEETG